MTPSTPPVLLIAVAILSTLAVAAFVIFVVFRSIRREQQGFEVQPSVSKPAQPGGPLTEPAETEHRATR